MANTNPNSRYDSWGKAAFWLILAAGLFLRGYQYFLNRTLWHDEAHLALNFVDLGYKGLMKPLENFQSAPIFFLFSIETCSRIFGLGEMSLRLVPFLLSIAALPVFYFFTAELTKSKLTAIIAFCIYALNLSFIYYASELKAYTVDISVYVVLGYIVISQNNKVVQHRTWLLIAAGCLAVLFSNITAIVFVCTGLYLMQQWHMQRQASNKRNVTMEIPVSHLYVFGCWAIVFFVNYFLFIYDHPYAQGMKDIWSYTFCPGPIFSKAFNEFVGTRVPDIVMNEVFLFDKGYYYIATLFIIIALVYAIYRKQYFVLVFTVLPFVLHLLLSMIAIYPFYYRFLLHAMPGIIILMSMGMATLIKLFSNKIYHIVASLAVVVCLVFSVKNSLTHFPRYDLKIKPALVYINEHYPNMPVMLTTPYSMYEYYYKIGFVKNPNYKIIPWNLTGETFWEDGIIKQQTNNFIILHSSKGGDNSPVFIPYLKEKGLVIKQFIDTDFAVTEVAVLPQPIADSVKN